MNRAYEPVICIDHDDWLAKRRKVIGASEAASALGLNAYDSPYALWMRKTGRAPEVEVTPAMERGTEWEPIVLERFRDKAPAMLGLPNMVTFHHPLDMKASVARPWLTCTLDGVVYRDGLRDSYYRTAEQQAAGTAVLEIKTADPAIDFDNAWAGDEVPESVQCQVQQQLAVTGWSTAYVAVQVGLRPLKIYTVERCDAFIDAMLKRLEAFWRCIETDTPPPADGSDATREALSKTKAAPGKVATLDGAALRLADLHAWKRKRRDLDDMIQAAENHIKAAMGDATEAVLDDGTKITFRTQTRKVKACEAIESTSRILRISYPRDKEQE